MTERHRFYDLPRSSERPSYVNELTTYLWRCVARSVVDDEKKTVTIIRSDMLAPKVRNSVSIYTADIKRYCPSWRVIYN